MTEDKGRIEEGTVIKKRERKKRVVIKKEKE